MNSIISFYRDFKEIKRLIKQSYDSRHQQIKFFHNHQVINEYTGNPYSSKDEWFFKFINNNYFFKNKVLKQNISFFSVNGERKFVKYIPGKKKIFFTVENVHVPFSHWQKYENLFLDDNLVDLSIGFDYLNHPQYLRFPYWIMTNFNPKSNYNDIKKRCHELNRPELFLEQRVNFCSLICKYDYFGDREFFYNEINKIDILHCDGNFRNNNNVLKNVFNNNKINFLKTYKFNLCPENSNTNGYVTEKIFEAISSGCIPIYWGSENKPEINILNQNAIIFIEPFKDNNKSTGLIFDIHTNKKLYLEFFNQDRLMPDSAEIIANYFSDLRKKINDIL